MKRRVENRELQRVRCHNDVFIHSWWVVGQPLDLKSTQCPGKHQPYLQTRPCPIAPQSRWSSRRWCEVFPHDAAKPRSCTPAIASGQWGGKQNQSLFHVAVWGELTVTRQAHSISEASASGVRWCRLHRRKVMWHPTLLSTQPTTMFSAVCASWSHRGSIVWEFRPHQRPSLFF